MHVEGRITVAKDILLDILLDQLDPIFKSRKDSLIVLVCSLTRFLISCCDTHEGAEEDGKRLLREQGTPRSEIKSRLIKKGYMTMSEWWTPLTSTGRRARWRPPGTSCGTRFTCRLLVAPGWLTIYKGVGSLLAAW